MTTFLLTVLLATVFTFVTTGFLSRPTGAVFLDSGAKSIGCLLNISTCGSTTATPSADTTEQAPAATDDGAAPQLDLNVTPILAGGNTQTVTITGTVSDPNLSSYSLKLNGNAVVEENGITDRTTIDINVPWSVSLPNTVPSGVYEVTLDATDTAGHAADTLRRTVTVDNDGPSVAIAGEGIIKSGSISPDVSASDPNGIASYTWSEDSQNPALLTFNHNAESPVFTPDVEGSYTLYMDVTDGLGNVSRTPYTFGYVQQLATVPMPISGDPTDALIDQSPSTPAITPASANPILQSGRDEVTASTNSAVLGSTTGASGKAAPVTIVSTIAPTASGWSIFGMLWYWWVVVLGLVFGAWTVFRKTVLTRAPQRT